ncbi:MAG: hypothetical protein K2X35_04785 [Bryobacteraceae bacterium]|nr:hypothetical protein [Bryobacteraceae bacterium]
MSTQAIPITGAHPRKISRFFIPSLSDFFFVFVIVWSFLTSPAGWERLLLDGDAGFHIRIGDLIRANAAVPMHDVFAFSVPGQKWYAFEWLSEVAYSAAHDFYGLKGVVLVAGLTLAAAFTILLRYSLWLGANALIAVPMVLVAVNAANIHFYARPHLFTWILLAIALWIVQRDRRSPGWAAWLLVPLTIVWANLHGGFFVFFPLLALLIAGEAAEAWLDGRTFQRAFRYARIAFACAVASLVNPYGFELHLHIAEVLNATWILTMVKEFQSPSFRGEAMLAYLGVLFLSLCLIGGMLRRRRMVEPLWILFLAYASLVSVRHVPVFVLVAAPLAAAELTHHWSAWIATRPRRSPERILDQAQAQFAAGAAHTSIWVVVFALVLMVIPGIAWPTAMPEGIFPHDFAEETASSRTFTSDQWADYLIYRNFPNQQVFLDGRHNYYGEKLLTEYQDLMNGHPRWRQLAARYQFDKILVPADSPLAGAVATSGEWRVARRDENAVLFERRR